MLDWTILIIAAFAAGVLNALAGGGTFLTFPALVHAGIPAIPANATATVAALPGYISSSLGFRAEIGRFGRRRLGLMAAIALLGGLTGSVLLLITPPQLFDAAVPWLLLFATLLFLAGDRITAMAAKGGHELAGLMLPGLFAVAVYGGYFNGGMGIMLITLFALTGGGDLNAANGLKNAASSVLSIVSVATFLIAGIVAIPEAAVMAVFATVGGIAGARLARKLPRSVVKAVVVTVGFTTAAIFFSR